MNNQRRTVLRRVIALLDEAGELLTEVLEAEQEAFDNLPEQFQESERGESMQDAIQAMEDFLDSFDFAELEELVE